MRTIIKIGLVLVCMILYMGSTITAHAACLSRLVAVGYPATSMQGTACKNGTMACANPGAFCALRGTLHCRTYDLDGKGTCSCVCI